MNFRLKFNISGITTLESTEIIARIQFELNEKIYITKDVTDTSVKFKDNLWRPHWRGEPYKLDQAEFVVSETQNDERLLTLTYNWMCYPYILWAICVTAILLLNHLYLIYLAFLGLFAAILLSDFLRCQWAADKLLTTILKADD